MAVLMATLSFSLKVLGLNKEQRKTLKQVFLVIIIFSVRDATVAKFWSYLYDIKVIWMT